MAPKEYRRRIIDDELDEILQGAAAVALDGPKGVGKTATAQRRAGSTVRLDDPAQRAIARADPRVPLQGKAPVLLDEWQYVPAIWDAVRRAVDEDDTPNRFC